VWYAVCERHGRHGLEEVNNNALEKWWAVLRGGETDAARATTHMESQGV